MEKQKKRPVQQKIYLLDIVAVLTLIGMFFLGYVLPVGFIVMRLAPAFFD